MKTEAGPLSLSEDLRGLSAKMLSWKEKYANIYYQKVGSHEYIFRPLSKKEYLALYFMQFHISVEAEDLLLEKCVLYPDHGTLEWNNLYAGEVAAIVEKILSVSGFAYPDNIKKDLDKERENVGLLDNQIVLIICKAFPHIAPSEIDNFDYPTIIHHVTLAEALLGTKLEITRAEDKTKIDFEKDNKGRGFNKRVFPVRPAVKK